MKTKTRGFLRSLAAGVLLCGTATTHAETMTFDFDSGFGSSFQTVSTDNLFTVDNAAGTVHVFKGSDDPSQRPNPNEFISGGVRSNFTLVGDFSVTVDFLLNNFPVAGTNQLNESVLSTASSIDPNDFGLMLRFTLFGNGQLVEGFTDTGGPLGTMGESTNTGKYRLVRTGSLLSGSYSSGNSSFLTLFSGDPVATDPFVLTLVAVQGANAGQRSGTALDISFDNLVVEADAIEMPAVVPLPGTLGLLGLGLAGLGIARRRQARA
jgi:hypothetical protein